MGIIVFPVSYVLTKLDRAGLGFCAVLQIIFSQEPARQQTAPWQFQSQTGGHLWNITATLPKSLKIG